MKGVFILVLLLVVLSMMSLTACASFKDGFNRAMSYGGGIHTQRHNSDQIYVTIRDKDGNSHVYRKSGNSTYEQVD